MFTPVQKDALKNLFLAYQSLDNNAPNKLSMRDKIFEDAFPLMAKSTLKPKLTPAITRHVKTTLTPEKFIQRVEKDNFLSQYVLQPEEPTKINSENQQINLEKDKFQDAISFGEITQSDIKNGNAIFVFSTSENGKSCNIYLTTRSSFLDENGKVSRFFIKDPFTNSQSDCFIIPAKEFMPDLNHFQGDENNNRNISELKELDFGPNSKLNKLFSGDGVPSKEKMDSIKLKYEKKPYYKRTRYEQALLEAGIDIGDVDSPNTLYTLFRLNSLLHIFTAPLMSVAVTSIKSGLMLTRLLTNAPRVLVRNIRIVLGQNPFMEGREIPNDDLAGERRKRIPNTELDKEGKIEEDDMSIGIPSGQGFFNKGKVEHLKQQQRNQDVDENTPVAWCAN